MIVDRLDEGGTAHLKLLVNPLVSLLWLAGLLLAAGGILAAWPSRRERAAELRCDAARSAPSGSFPHGRDAPRRPCSPRRHRLPSPTSRYTPHTDALSALLHTPGPGHSRSVPRAAAAGAGSSGRSDPAARQRRVPAEPQADPPTMPTPTDTSGASSPARCCLHGRRFADDGAGASSSSTAAAAPLRPGHADPSTANRPAGQFVGATVNVLGEIVEPSWYGPDGAAGDVTDGARRPRISRRRHHCRDRRHRLLPARRGLGPAVGRHSRQAPGARRRLRAAGHGGLGTWYLTLPAPNSMPGLIRRGAPSCARIDRRVLPLRSCRVRHRAASRARAPAAHAP